VIFGSVDDDSGNGSSRIGRCISLYEKYLEAKDRDPNSNLVQQFEKAFVCTGSLEKNCMGLGPWGKVRNIVQTVPSIALINSVIVDNGSGLVPEIGRGTKIFGEDARLGNSLQRGLTRSKGATGQRYCDGNLCGLSK
jgi:hypothetical protein